MVSAFILLLFRRPSRDKDEQSARGSAEAVQQVLQRLADILVSVVRGDSSEVKAELADENSEKNAEARKNVVDVKAARATGSVAAVDAAPADLDNVLKK